MKRFLHTEQHLGKLSLTVPDGILIQPASSLQCNMLLSGSGSCTVDWGDGTSTTNTLGTDTAFSRTYATGAERTIKLYGEITTLKNGTVFACGGDVANLPRSLTRMIVLATNTLTGDVADLPSGLTEIEVYGSNTLSGDVADLPAGLTSLIIVGSNTLSGDVADLPAGLTYLRLQGSNTLSGDVADLPSGITYIYMAGTNTLSGDVADLPAGLTNLYLTGANTITSASTIPLPLSYLKIERAFSAAEVDNLLAAMWANKDAAKPNANRIIDLDGGGAATPSSAGLATKALLQAYRTPNNDPAKPLWTVLTN